MSTNVPKLGKNDKYLIHSNLIFSALALQATGRVSL